MDAQERRMAVLEALSNESKALAIGILCLMVFGPIILCLGLMTLLYSPGLCCLCVSFIFSLVAGFVFDFMRYDTQQQTTDLVVRLNLNRWVFGCGMFLGIGLSGWLWYQELAQTRFERLLLRHDDIEITSIAITHDSTNLHIRLDDPESVQYLNSAFRRASSEGYELGASWDVKINLSRGRTAKCWFYIPDNPSSLTIGISERGLGEIRYFRIPLDKPMPQPLASLLAQLR